MAGLEDHWRRDSFDRLDRVVDLIANGPQSTLYKDYLLYLDLKRRGQRKEALRAANRFISTYKDDPFEVRQRICWWLIKRTEPYWESWPAAGNWLFPGNIESKLMTSMFEEWRQREPKNVNAWLYPLGSGLEWRAETAFMLEPSNPRCQYAELTRLTRRIGFAIHELEHIGFVLDPPDEFSAMIGSLTVVTESIGANLAKEVHETLNWLHALARVHAETEVDLRPTLAERGIVKPSHSTFHQTNSWFRETPQFWDR